MAKKKETPKVPLCACGHVQTDHEDNGEGVCKICRVDGSMGVIGCPHFAPGRRRKMVDPFEYEIAERKRDVVKAVDALLECAMRARTDIDPMQTAFKETPVETIRQDQKSDPTEDWGRPLEEHDIANIEEFFGPTTDAIVRALIDRGPLSTARLSLYSGYSISGSFTKAIGLLRKGGFITNDQPIVLTHAGREYAKRVTLPPLPMGSDLFDHWKDKNGPTGQLILEALLVRGPLTTSQLSEATKRSISGSFTKAIGKLRKMGLVSKGQPIALAPELVEEAE